MMEQYRKTMDTLTLSETAEAQFYEKLEAAIPVKKRRPTALLAVAACLCLLIPLTVFAVTNHFGNPNSEVLTDPPYRGTGYVVSTGNTYRRPIADFSPELQTLNDSVQKDFADWKEVEEYIGFTLLDAPALFSGEIEKRNILLTADGKSHIYHCLTSFVGDGQLFMGHVEAYFQKGPIRIDLRATVAADHPEMTDEVMESIHISQVIYRGNQTVEISSENITTQAGIPVCITTAQLDVSTDYEATFSINGVSFTLVIRGHGKLNNEEAKAILLEILESIRL